MIVRDVANQAKVSLGFTKKCLNEIKIHRDVIDPEKIKLEQLQSQIIHYKISKIDKVFNLLMHAKEPRHPNVDYVTELLFHQEVQVYQGTISNFFNRRFDIKGTFIKPNLIPLDKWKLANLANFHDFLILLKGFLIFLNTIGLIRSTLSIKTVFPIESDRI